MSDPKRSDLVAYFANKYMQSEGEFANTLMATIMPNQKATVAQVHALLVVAKEHDLNPWTREIYAFPGRGGSIMPIVGLDGWLRLANRHEQFDGYDIEFITGDDGDEGCKISVYRKDRTHPTVHIAWHSECERSTEPWKNMPKRMLENRATCQGLRRAFSFSGIYDPDEAAQAAEFQEAEAIDVEATEEAPLSANDAVEGMRNKLMSAALDKEAREAESESEQFEEPNLTDVELDAELERAAEAIEVDADDIRF